MRVALRQPPWEECGKQGVWCIAQSFLIIQPTIAPHVLLRPMGYEAVLARRNKWGSHLLCIYLFMGYEAVLARMGYEAVLARMKAPHKIL